MHIDRLAVASALRLCLGDTCTTALAESRVVAAQTLSGTGGLYLAARMLGAPGGEVRRV